jgi:hypothetical protein
VRWYRLVDPEMRTFEVLELGADGRYAHAVAATVGVLASVSGCEALRIDVGGYGRRSTRWLAAKMPS